MKSIGGLSVNDVFTLTIKLSIQNQEEQLRAWEYELHTQLTEAYKQRMWIRRNLLRGINDN